MNTSRLRENRTMKTPLMLLAGIAALALVLGSCGKPAQGGKNEQNPAQPGAVTAEEGGRVIVYYFHTTFRCYSCRKIEELTADALTDQFGEELKNRAIVFKKVNVELDENKHFIRDYQLFTKTVVLAKNADGGAGKWKRLDDTWQLMRDRDAYYRYIRDEVTRFMDKG